MPTNTKNYGFIKPTQEEFYDVAVPNANMETIDGILKTFEDAVNSGASEQEIAQIRQDLSTHMAEKATTTGYGHTILNPTITSTSNSEAATAGAVKKTYDLADAAIPKSQIGKPNGVPKLDENGNVLKADGSVAGTKTFFEKFLLNGLLIKKDTTYTRKIKVPGEMVFFRIYFLTQGNDKTTMSGTFESTDNHSLLEEIYAIYTGNIYGVIPNIKTNNDSNVDWKVYTMNTTVRVQTFRYLPDTHEFEFTLINKGTQDATLTFGEYRVEVIYK